MDKVNISNLALEVGGFLNPYTRCLTVDAGGAGDFTTIIDAIGAAILQGASTATPWTIYVQPGTYVGDLTLQDGISIVGASEYLVYVVGSLTGTFAGPGNAIAHLNIAPVAHSATTTAMKITLTTSSGRFFMVNCISNVQRAWDGPTIALELDGAGAGFMRASNCTFYAYNTYTGSVTTTTIAGQSIRSAKAVLLHTTPACKGYIEAMPGCRFKTSTGLVGATAEAILAWTQGSGAFVGVHCDGHWDGISAQTPILHLNENATYKGGMVNATFTSSDTPSRLRVVNVFTALANQALNDMYLNNLDLAGEFTAGGGKAPMLWGKFPATSYMQSPYGNRAATALAVDAGIAASFPVAHKTTFNRLALEVTTAAGTAGSYVDVYVFADNGSSRPGGTALAVAPLDTTVTGFKFLDVTPFTLMPGNYWLVAVARVAVCSVYCLSGPACPVVPQTNGVNNRTGLAGTVPAGGNTFTYTATSINAPAVMVRTA
jgi:hypothetical protein